MREIAKIICSCGGEPIEVPTTEDERAKYGCSHDSEDWSCCVGAFECPKCKTKWTFSYEAPEIE